MFTLLSLAVWIYLRGSPPCVSYLSEQRFWNQPENYRVLKLVCPLCICCTTLAFVRLLGILSFALHSVAARVDFLSAACSCLFGSTSLSSRMKTSTDRLFNTKSRYLFFLVSLPLCVISSRYPFLFGTCFLVVSIPDIELRCTFCLTDSGHSPSYRTKSVHGNSQILIKGQKETQEKLCVHLPY